MLKHPDDDTLVLIDANNNVIGSMDKLQAHQEGRFHRCISIQIFDEAGRWLLQQRAPRKYHSPNLWSNTCCGHQRPDEDNLEAAHRRLQHEMGFDCDLKFIGTFEYSKEFPDIGLSEHEFDYVYIGILPSDRHHAVNPHPDEVQTYRWVTIDQLQAEVVQNRDGFTYWFYAHVIDFVGRHYFDDKKSSKG